MSEIIIQQPDGDYEVHVPFKARQGKRYKLVPVDENSESIQAWICPRCAKVHSWLSMTCDCEPKTITSTTY